MGSALIEEEDEDEEESDGDGEAGTVAMIEAPIYPELRAQTFAAVVWGHGLHCPEDDTDQASSNASSSALAALAFSSRRGSGQPT
eukprot:CAMPEP_0119499442 /NCGR_PEP_ID=MMETSP1344-20130328/21897_1 /TAXON_ID=236787 /ORGANISM="Florenciella parvula, Strain CCMP2471" /LENGTH=84 /DNA_ID=CAMNT_0007535437 /DNA_START=42 /DNA_END=296 /DNA_ORIENTATION=-